jgi:hypothetical protein
MSATPPLDRTAAVTDALTREFRRVLPVSTISAVVSRARRDLAAHVLDAGFPESLALLCRTRLTQLQMELIA